MSETAPLFITIDTEAHKGPDPVRDWIWGRLGGEDFGIRRIMASCERYGFRATFFVDVCEVASWGREPIKAVCDEILARGHDVQLHVHPDHLADPKRLFLWEYSLAEQKEILGRSLEIYRDLTGENPIAFRAGKYGANWDTLTVLEQLGIPIDCSLFHTQRWCHIDNKPGPKNTIHRIGGILEVPVTVYRSISIPFLPPRFDKVDVNSCYLPEMKFLIDRLLAGDLGHLVLFLHSFSFLRKDASGRILGTDPGALRIFEGALHYLHQSGTPVMTLKEFHGKSVARGIELHVTAPEVVPSYPSYPLQCAFTFARAWAIKRTNAKAAVVVAMAALAALLLVLVCVWVAARVA